MNKTTTLPSKRLCLTGLVLLLGLAAFIFIPDKEKTSYFQNQGKVFGTYYNIRYSATADLEEGILASLQQVDNSLSTFNPQSTISLINSDKGPTTDSLFEVVYNTAKSVSEITDGAFDITVAPLVNAWGFGFKNKENVTPELIDSLLQFVGYEKIDLVEHHITKTDSRIMLDASAIAKGFGCDVVAHYLNEQGCENYLVDIGGEVVCHGVNQNGDAWSIGITKPEDDVTCQVNEIQEIIQANDLCMATSGNYRQFYYEGEQKRSHTIDPRTGYPVGHNLLSATVVAESCMKADALATACMVLGTEKALDLIKKTPNTACYLIYAADNGTQIACEKFGGFIKNE